MISDEARVHDGTFSEAYELCVPDLFVCERVCVCEGLWFIHSGGSSCDDSLTGELGRASELSLLAN